MVNQVFQAVFNAVSHMDVVDSGFNQLIQRLKFVLKRANAQTVFEKTLAGLS